MGRLHVVGVRHHSPACARLVEHVVRRVKPSWVLVEGPADMNERIGELTMQRELPFAVFSYRTDATGSYASWSPFCDYSPEWVALRVASEVGARAAFVDLPAWHRAFANVRNRYSDRHSRASDRMLALCERLALEDTDALWDHLFEQPCAPDDLAARLGVYFRELRADEPAGERDAEREAYMARWIAWATREAGGDVVVVCGGFHAPALEAAWRAHDGEAARPEVPGHPEGARIGSYLVPYSFRRLDAFVGYESGMPSPGYYQTVWERGATDDAAESMLFDAVVHLRDKKQRVSAADVIAASSLATGLKSLRGHRALARIDVLDGLAGALVKDALETPLPWNRRGRILPRTDPLLVEIVRAFSGDRVGVLAAGTPQPPLVADAYAEIARAGIPYETKPARVTLPLTEPEGLAKSRVLHRLRVLGVPGVTRTRAPSWTREDTSLSEEWSVEHALDADAALIEAAAYGATLEGAAAGKLEEELHGAERLGELAAILFEAALVGIHTLAERVLVEVRRVADSEPSLGEVGKGLSRLFALWKHDTLLGAQNAHAIGAAIVAAFDRGLWLYEGVQGAVATGDADQVGAAVAMRDCLRHAETKLGLDRARAHAVMQRRALDRDAPPDLRGAALGFLWSTSFFGADAAAETEATVAMRASARPDALGDFLSGLFATAREEVVTADALLVALDDVVQSMTEHDFLVAVPSLRLAFAWFPPREKETIARRLLVLHGKAPAGARDLLRLEVEPAAVARGATIDAAATAVARRFGLLDDLDAEPEPEPTPAGEGSGA